MSLESGVQVYDAQGEALMVLVPADWTGWKWIELDLADAEQAYPQADKNRTADYPLKSVHVVWFTEAAGPHVVDRRWRRRFDSIAGCRRFGYLGGHVRAGNGRRRRHVAGVGFRHELSPSSRLDSPFATRCREIRRCTRSRFPIPYSARTTPPVRAVGWWWMARSIEDTSSTDGKPWTAATTPWQRDHYHGSVSVRRLGPGARDPQDDLAQRRCESLVVCGRVRFRGWRDICRRARA